MFMLIARLDSTEGFVRKNPAARQPLTRWVRVVAAARWQSIVDARESIPSADAVKGTNLTCFNIGGNKYRLLTIVSYRRQAVTIVELLTHAQYSRKYT